jgi:hypothetical protein
MNRRQFVTTLAGAAALPIPRHRPFAPAMLPAVDVVARYGVRNDGSEPAGATNSARVTTALADIGRAGGGTLLFRAGVYQMSNGLTVPSDRITIAGEGRATIFEPHFAAASTDFVFACSSRRDVVFRDFVVRGSHAGGIRIHGSGGCGILACDVSGAVRPNAQGFCAGIYVSDVDDLTIDGCSLFGNGRGRARGVENDADICANMGSEQIRSSRISNNRCTSTTVHQNIAVYDPFELVVSGNTAAGALVSQKKADKQGYGILLYHTATLPAARRGVCRITDNLVRDTEGTGIFIQGIPDAVIANNTVMRSGAVQIDGALAVAGILVEGVVDPSNVYGAGGGRVGRQTVTGNRVSDCARAGISLSSTTATVCSANVIDRCRYGISVRGESADLQIVGNLVTNILPSGESIGIGQWSDTPISRIRIAGNMVRGVPAAAVGIWARQGSARWTIVDNDVSGVDGGTAYVMGGQGHAIANNRADGRSVTWPP